jgi:hypothetical protein
MKILKWFLICFSICLLPFYSIAAIEVEGSLRHVHEGIRGDVYRGEIKLHNSDEINHEVKIYQTDLQYNFKDFTFYEEPVSHNRSNAKWIQFSPKTVIIKGHETIYVQYEVTIPKSDSIKGTYWSVLMIEGVIPIDPNKPGQLNISTVTRYAVQIVTEIADRGVDDLKILEPSLITEGDQVFLAIDIENTGGNYISPDVSIELFDDAGKSVKTINAPKKGLFPTTSARFRFSLEGIEGNKNYQVVIIAAGQDKSVFGLEYTLYL